MSASTFDDDDDEEKATLVTPGLIEGTKLIDWSVKVRLVSDFTEH